MTNKGLAAIVGAENVMDTGEIIKAYSKDLSFVPGARPRCVAKPGSAAEVQAIIGWANETSTTLVPVSSGPPHFRGDTVPGREGAAIVDLSRMNRILRVDAKNRIVMVEAGVTFGDLVPVLSKEGIRLNLPLLPRSSKSVIGSMLEREPVVMPLYQWDAVDPLSCIEVIFGTGDPFRTGTSAGPGNLEAQWKSGQAQVNPMGPGQTDFARVVQGAQGTMGIVTWATVRCEKTPAITKPYMVGADWLEALSDFIYRTLWLKAADTSLVVNRTTLATMAAKGPEEFVEMRNALPEWIYLFSLAGHDYFPEEKLAYQEKDILEAAGRFGLKVEDAFPGVSAHGLLDLLSKPSMEPFWKLRPRGAFQDIFFITTLDRTADFIEAVYGIAEANGILAADMGTYVQPMVQGTSCHCEFTLFYDPENMSEVEKVRGTMNRACDAVLNLGGFFSRPYGAFAGRIYEKDPDTAAVLKKIKNMFDPNDIMNTGKLCFQ